MDSTPLIDALIIAIPVVFNLQISHQIDHENPEEIQKIFHHVTLTEMKIGKKALLNIISALTIHGTSLSLTTSTSCLISLCRLPARILQEKSSMKLVENLLNILNSPKVVFTDYSLVDSVLFKMVMRYKESKYLSILFNQTFFNKVFNLETKQGISNYYEH